MVKLGLETLHINESKLKVLDTELKKSGISYTIETVNELRKQNSDCDFYLVIGIDQFQQFSQWRDYLKLLKAVNLIVTSRPGYNLPATKIELPSWVQALVKSMQKNRIVLTTGRSIQLVQLNDVKASASEIRRKIRRNENVTHLTPGTIVDYALKSKIYDPHEALVSDYREFAQFCSKVISDKGGLGVQAYDVRKMVQPSEFTIVASGTSQRHSKALCEHVVMAVKERYGLHPQSTEGMDEGRWAIVDYGSLIIHVFYDFVRNEYRIEDLWSQAEKITFA